MEVLKDMINISINKVQIGKKFVKCCLDMKGTAIVGLKGKLSNTVVNVILGKTDFEGNIYIDGVSLKDDFEHYIKCIRYFSGKHRKNFYNICVNDYMDLFGILGGLNFDPKYEKMKIKYLSYFGLQKYIYKSTKELGIEQMICLEFLCGFLKQPKLIIIDHFMDEVSKECKIKIYQFILEYINNIESLCVIIEYKILSDRCNKIVNLDAENHS